MSYFQNSPRQYQPKYNSDDRGGRPQGSGRGGYGSRGNDRSQTRGGRGRGYAAYDAYDTYDNSHAYDGGRGRGGRSRGGFDASAPYQQHRNRWSSSSPYYSSQPHRGPHYGRSRGYRNRSNASSSSHTRSRSDFKYSKSLGYQPRTIGQRSLDYLGKYEFHVSEKCDGQRLFCYLTTHRMYLIDREFNVYQLTPPFYSDSHGLGHNTLLDGELAMTHMSNAAYDRYVVDGYLRTQFHTLDAALVHQYFHCDAQYSQLTYLVFDCMVYNGLSVTGQNASVRFQHLDKFMRLYYNKLASKDKLSDVAANDVAGDDDKQVEQLSDVSTKLDNADPGTKSLKDEILNLLYSKSAAEQSSLLDTSGVHNHNHAFDVTSVAYKLPLKFAKKTYYQSTQQDLKRLFSHIVREADKTYFYTDPATARRNRNDGVVFTPEHNDYFMRRHKADQENEDRDAEITRKWKPAELTTIDVKVYVYRKFCRDPVDRFVNDNDQDGMVCLFTFDLEKRENVQFAKIDIGSSQNASQWTVFQKSQREVLKRIYEKSHEQPGKQQVNHLIVECCYSVEHESWQIMHWRSDKSVANVLTTCESTWKRITEPFTQKDLINACKP